MHHLSQLSTHFIKKKKKNYVRSHDSNRHADQTMHCYQDQNYWMGLTCYIKMCKEVVALINSNHRNGFKCCNCPSKTVSWSTDLMKIPATEWDGDHAHTNQNIFLQHWPRLHTQKSLQPRLKDKHSTQKSLRTQIVFVLFCAHPTTVTDS